MNRLQRLLGGCALATLVAGCSGVTYPEPGWKNIEVTDIMDGTTLISYNNNKYWNRRITVEKRQNGNIIVFFRTDNLASNVAYFGETRVKFLLDGVVFEEILLSTVDGKSLYVEGDRAKKWIQRLNKGNNLVMRVLGSIKKDEAFFDISGKTRFN